jgi:tRNA-modifying protein YgfZ
MMQAKFAVLPDRGVVRVAGEDAGKLLQDVITNDMDLLGGQPAIHAALLTPQGKILFEFFVVKAGEGAYLLETGREQAAGLAKRLGMYKLRAKVTIEDVGSDYDVWSTWGAPTLIEPWNSEHISDREDLIIVDMAFLDASSFIDPRLYELGKRWIVVRRLRHQLGKLATAEKLSMVPAEDYHAHRTALGVPEGGRDYALGDTFPHEADMDRLGGVSFTKGCFVGQEVVSRMQHRAHVRKRVVPVEVAGPGELKTGAEITIGTAVIGKVGSVAARQGLAMLRLDRAAEAKAKGLPLTAGGIEVVLCKPDWLAASDLVPAAAAETS